MNKFEKKLEKKHMLWILLFLALVIGIILLVVFLPKSGKKCNNTYDLNNPATFPGKINKNEITRAFGLRGMVNFPGKEPKVCKKLLFPNFTAASKFCSDNNKEKQCAGLMVETVANEPAKYYVIFDYDEYSGWKNAKDKQRNVNTYIFVDAGNFKPIGEKDGAIFCHDSVNDTTSLDCPAVYYNTPTWKAGDNKTACRPFDKNGKLIQGRSQCKASDKGKCMCAPPVKPGAVSYREASYSDTLWPWWAEGCTGDCWNWDNCSQWVGCDDFTCCDDCCCNPCSSCGTPPGASIPPSTTGSPSSGTATLTPSSAPIGSIGLKSMPTVPVTSTPSILKSKIPPVLPGSWPISPELPTIFEEEIDIKGPGGEIDFKEEVIKYPGLGEIDLREIDFKGPGGEIDIAEEVIYRRPQMSRGGPGRGPYTNQQLPPGNQQHIPDIEEVNPFAGRAPPVPVEEPKKEPAKAPAKK